LRVPITVPYSASAPPRRKRLYALPLKDKLGQFLTEPINGLLCAARTHGLSARTVDLRNSGDTAGPRDEVVGYGAYVFTPEATVKEE
jgi:hypothetical protein